MAEIDKLPPHDTDAEEAVIGSLLIDGSAIAQVVELLDVKDFYYEQGQWLYEACLNLYKRKDSINQITVAQELSRQNRLENCGGAAHLSYLVSICPTSLDIVHYARIVSRLSFMRQLVVAGERISSIGYSSAPDVAKSLDGAVDILHRVRAATKVRPKPNPPEFQSDGVIFRFNWQDIGVRAVVDRVSEDGRNVLSGELTLWHTSDGAIENEKLIDKARIALTSNRTRNELAKSLSERINYIDWSSIVRDISILTLGDYRQGQPAQMIGDKPEYMETNYVLYPLIEQGDTVTIFGHGGSGKSYLGLYIAMLVQAAEKGIQNWFARVGGLETLYLDWESSEQLYERRFWAVKAGADIGEGCRILYRYCTQPLASDIEEIRRIVAENCIDFIIVDSQVAACGGDVEKSDTINAYYSALRSTECTSLTLDHTPWTTTEGARPFGSVFKWNRARSLFELRKSTDPAEDAMELGLFHVKHNEGRILSPIGIRVLFDYEDEGKTVLKSVKFQDMDISETTDLSKRLQLKDRMIAELRGGSMKPKELADALETTVGTVQSYANRYTKIFTRPEKGVIALLEGKL